MGTAPNSAPSPGNEWVRGKSTAILPSHLWRPWGQFDKQRTQPYPLPGKLASASTLRPVHRHLAACFTVALQSRHLTRRYRPFASSTKLIPCRASTGSPRTAAPSAAFYKWYLARSCHLSRYRASTGCGVLDRLCRLVAPTALPSFAALLGAAHGDLSS